MATPQAPPLLRFAPGEGPRLPTADRPRLPAGDRPRLPAVFVPPAGGRPRSFSLSAAFRLALSLPPLRPVAASSPLPAGARPRFPWSVGRRFCIDAAFFLRFSAIDLAAAASSLHFLQALGP